MNISKEEVNHIANLADLIIDESEVDKYAANLQDILEFTTIIDGLDVDNIDITISANETKNAFRKDEVKQFDNIEQMLQNAPAVEQNMVKIPKVIQ